MACETSRHRRGKAPRAFLRVAGPDAADYLQRMVSNDVEALAVGEACDALLLTAKARVIAPLRVLRRGEDDFLVLTEPELGDTVRTQLLRMRFAAKAEIEPEEHESWLVLGGEEVLDDRSPQETRSARKNSNAGGSKQEFRAGAERSTSRSFRPKRASTRRISASAKAAIPARSQSRVSATAEK